MPDLDQIDPTFVEDLKESQRYVWAVARWLSGQGEQVVVLPQSIRPSAEDRMKYSDGGDLAIIKRVEVKHRDNLHFTSAADYPYDSVMVDAAHKYDLATIKPYAYIILNKDVTCCAIVYASTKNTWKRESKFDKGRYQDFYMCPVGYAIFKNITVNEA